MSGKKPAGDPGDLSEKVRKVNGDTARRPR